MGTVLIILVFVIILILIWALFGGDREESDTPRMRNDEKTAAETPEKMFRKRSSDREIEEAFPEDQLKRRRKTDQSVPEPGEPQEETDEGFKLPYLADQIIPEASRLRVYKRTLANSEIYAGKGDYNTAISLYEGVKSRTRDTEIRFKIDENINYLKNYKSKKKRAEDKAKADKKSAPPADPQEVKLKLDGSQTIQIGVMDGQQLSADSIVEKVSKEIRSELSELQKRDVNDIKDSLKDLQADNQHRIQQLEKLTQEQIRHDEFNEERDTGITETIKKEMEELSELKDELNDLSKNIYKSMAEAPEVHSKPTVLEARYDQPIPVQIDPKPILEILEKLPGNQGASKSISGEEVKGQSASGAPGHEKAKDDHDAYSPGTSPDESSRFSEDKDITERTKEEEPDEEYDLLQNIIKGKEDQDSLSDEEIFERLLSQDHKSPMGKEIEILGEKQNKTEDLDYLSRSADAKQASDDDFYRNLLKSDRHKKRELPILKVSYDFKKLPDEMSLSREKNLLQHSFYRYKPMLEKAQGFIDKRQVRDAINYYKVVLAQNIPPEFKSMIRRNINDLTEYLEKYLSGE